MNDPMISQAVKALRAHRFEVYPCASAQEAAQLAVSLIPKSHSVGWGGSMSVEATGVLSLLRQEGYTLIDRDTAKTPEERIQLMRRALLADTFLTSANAISCDGCLVNIDGNGNRVAAMCYGPSSVIVIAGRNKLAPDLPAALERARNTAAPANAKRLSKATPCTADGACHNCLSPQTICCQFLTTRVCNPAGRIKIILVDDDLGF